MKKKQKLELTWIGKEDQPRLEPRILIEDPEKSYGDPNTENMLIYGDNLLALKALEQDFAGQIKCIYIDPPYNTGAAFDHYDDGVEHSLWLSLIKARIQVLHNLLSIDGSMWVSIDDNEGHYLKVLLDEVFGRRNFVSTVIWQKKYAPKADSKFLSESHDFILCYAKQIDRLTINRLPKTEKQISRYKNRDNDPRGPWKPGDTLRNEVRDYAVFPVKLPSGKEAWPSPGTSWRYTKEKFHELIEDNRIWFGVKGTARPAIKRFLSEVSDTIPATTIWSYAEAGHNDESKKESKALFGENLFDTPKPERLIQRILTIASNKGDLVLDSFLGSGTTAAVAHKMGRRYIGVELGEHCHTHCLPRLKLVAEGTDQGGISKPVGWKGGGGFKYFYLAPSLLKQDRYGNWVIDERYNADMLAAAMAKHEGFRYSPDEQVYWKQGQSTEKDFIFTTTQIVTVEVIDKISTEMQPDESLLICCKTFQKECEDRHPHITVRKIPGMLLGRCEFGKDDYSLNIITMPEDPDAPEFVPVGPQQPDPKSETKKGKPKQSKQKKLF